MNTVAIKTVLRHVAGWGTVILFAVLLTLIFSFLGAFFCAALTGMMLGSFKFPRWQTVALSLIFPVVLFTILRTGGAELLIGQTLMLSVLCVGTFWLTYLVVRAVVWYERKGQSSSALRPAIPRTCPPNPASQEPHDARNRVQSLASRNGMPKAKLSLQVLQGKWSCTTPNFNSAREHKCLEIQQENLLLTISDSAGQVSFMGCGEVKLRDGKAGTLLSISQGFLEPDDTLVCI